MKKNWFARFGNADQENATTVYDIHPDVAEAFADAIRNRANIQPPRHAKDFDDLTDAIAQTSRVIQHMEAFRELAIIKADQAGGPHADRKALGIAAGMPRSRLYRILDKYGRPRDRRAAE